MSILTPEITSLLIALALGLAIGLERSFAGKTAGMRTYGLVAMGACLFILLAGIVAPVGDPTAFDQMRTLAAVVMGIGFIGGGTILRTHDHNHDHASGLTTAAGLWVAAGIGAAVGYGLVKLAVTATLLTLVVFTLLWFVEHAVTRNE